MAAQVEYRVPLLRGQVDAGRVMATGMQQHDGVRGQLLETGQHALERDVATRLVQVRVAVNREAGAAEDCEVVVPGWVADPHARLGVVTLEEVGPHAQGPGATYRLQGDDAIACLRGDLAEQIGLNRVAKSWVAIHGQVQVGCGGDAIEFRLGCLDRVQHRYLSCFIVIEANAQVDLLGAVVAVEVVHQGQNGVAWVGFDLLEHLGYLQF
ncbi:hypothetical protein D3C79_829650 [compost metagenome]